MGQGPECGRVSKGTSNYLECLIIVLHTENRRTKL